VVYISADNWRLPGQLLQQMTQLWHQSYRINVRQRLQGHHRNCSQQLMKIVQLWLKGSGIYPKPPNLAAEPIFTTLASKRKNAP